MNFQFVLAIAWALVAAFRLGQGDYHIAFLDFYIAYLTFTIWEGDRYDL